MRNKKGEMNALSLVGYAILIFLILGIMLYAVPPVLKKGVSGAALQQCMTTQDIDGDDLKVNDKCPCDPGNLDEQEAYYLKGHSECVMMTHPFKSDPTLFVYADGVDVEKCGSIAEDLNEELKTYGSGNNVCPETELSKLKRSLTNKPNPDAGATEACVKALAEIDPKDKKKPLVVCPTMQRVCEEKFKRSPLCKAE